MQPCPLTGASTLALLSEAFSCGLQQGGTISFLLRLRAPVHCFVARTAIYGSRSVAGPG